MLHSLVEMSGPRLSQSLPPFAAGGLVQVRLRVSTPPPHVLVHLPYCDQAEYPPFTSKRK